MDLTGIICVRHSAVIVASVIAFHFLVFIIRHKSCRAGVVPSGAKHVSDQSLRNQELDMSEFMLNVILLHEHGIALLVMDLLVLTAGVC